MRRLAIPLLILIGCSATDTSVTVTEADRVQGCKPLSLVSHRAGPDESERDAVDALKRTARTMGADHIVIVSRERSGKELSFLATPYRCAKKATKRSLKK